MEQDLGVLLVGLDAIYSLHELFGGTHIIGSLVVHFVPVIEQLDRMLTLENSELTLWLLKPLRFV